MKNIFYDEKENKIDYEKIRHKMRVSRNEFKVDGKFDIPIIKRQVFDTKGIKTMSYTKTKLNDIENADKVIQFFTYDWKFDNVYDSPDKTFEKLFQYRALLTPDFSMYIDMPIAQQIHSVFKSRWCGAFWQSQGLNVIPSVSWGIPKSFAFCFDGIERGSIVAVSTYKMENNKPLFLHGYDEMLKVINPSEIICYGDKFDEMQGNITEVSPYDHEKIMKQMGIGRDEYLAKFMAGEIYPSE